jgi:hypothetical protein
MIIVRIKETKYLTFATGKIEGRKTRVVHIINKSNIVEIGTIEWYGNWRQYCFMPSLEFDTVWNNECLTDIVSVINDLMKERTINKPEGE